MSDENAIALILRRQDEVTTSLGRKIIVGSVHRDEKVSGRWWIEPEDADDYTWWLPVSNVIQVNGRDVGLLEGECTMTAVEKALFRDHTAHSISKLKFTDDTIDILLHPYGRENATTSAKFSRARNISIDRSYVNSAMQFPWSIIGLWLKGDRAK